MPGPFSSLKPAYVKDAHSPFDEGLLRQNSKHSFHDELASNSA